MKITNIIVVGKSSHFNAIIKMYIVFDNGQVKEMTIYLSKKVPIVSAGYGDERDTIGYEEWEMKIREFVKQFYEISEKVPISVNITVVNRDHEIFYQNYYRDFEFPMIEGWGKEGRVITGWRWRQDGEDGDAIKIIFKDDVTEDFPL